MCTFPKTQDYTTSHYTIFITGIVNTMQEYDYNDTNVTKS